MENQHPAQINKMKKWLPYFVVGVFGIVALVSLYFAYQANRAGRTTPPEFKKVSAVTGVVIPVIIKTDGTTLYYEHNAERLSLTNRIGGLLINTRYTLTITNNSGVKQGIFIPSLKENVVIDNTQSTSVDLTFGNPGTYYFLGNVYQTGWDSLKSGFDVGLSTTETPPPGPGTSTPTATATLPPTKNTPTVTPTATTTPTATLTLTPTVTLTATPVPTTPPTAFDCTIVTEVPQSECQALVDLYNSTNGPGWRNAAGWLQTNTPCSWYNITCNSEMPRTVTDISLSSNNLVGTIPNSIVILNLQGLYLSANSISGSIPADIGQMTNLRNLYLNDNRMSGGIPASIGNLTELRNLTLKGNLLSGSIPSQLGSLNNLLNLGLDFNRLSGDIPDTIGQLTQLRTLHLANNNYTGTVPTSFANLTQISGMNVTLANNSLTGVENQIVCPWLAIHSAGNWWQAQTPPIASNPCASTGIEEAQPVAARSTGIGKLNTKPVVNQNIFMQIALFFQQLLRNVFRVK